MLSMVAWVCPHREQGYVLNDDRDEFSVMTRLRPRGEEKWFLWRCMIFLWVGASFWYDFMCLVWFVG